MRILIDFLPTEASEASSLRTALHQREIEARLSLEEVDISSDLESQIGRLADASDYFIILWSHTAAALFGAQQILAVKELVRRVFRVGPEKFVIWSHRGTQIPFELSDFPSLRTQAEVVEFLADRKAQALTTTMDTDSISMQPASANKEVFLSHSAKDSHCAEKLLTSLEAERAVWYAPRDMRAPGLYGNAILSAIRDCRCLLFLLTANSLKSPHCLREVYLALENLKPITVLSELNRNELTQDWLYPLAGLHLTTFNCHNMPQEDLRSVLH